MGILDLGAINKVANVAKEVANVEEYNSNIAPLSRAINVGKNLFNKANIIEGKYLNSLGKIVEHASYYMAYIPVDINIGSKIAIRYIQQYCAQCDVNKNVISGTITNASPLTLVPECCYVLVSDTLAHIPNLQVVCYGDAIDGTYTFDSKASVSVRVVENDLQLPDIKDYDKNLLDNSRWKNGIALSTSGVEVPTEGYILTDWILVNPKIDKKFNFLIRRGYQMGPIARIVYFDENRKVLGYGESIPYTTGYFEVPDGTRYIRFHLTTVDGGIEGILKYSCFPINWMDLKPYSGGDRYNMITADDIIPKIRMTNSSIAPSNENDCAITTFIPVKPDTAYFINRMKQGLDSRAHWYGMNKEDLGALTDADTGKWGSNNYIKSPQNAYFIVFGFRYMEWDNSDRDRFIGMVEVDKWDGKVGMTIQEDERVRVAATTGEFPCSRNQILGVYEDFIAVLDFTGTKIRFSGNGWKAKNHYNSAYIYSGWYEYPINAETFPNMLEGTTINQIVFFSTSNGSTVGGTACLVFGSSNQIWYCADCRNVMSLTFGVPNVWDLKGQKHWRIDENVEGNSITSGGVTRYKMYYPSDTSSRLGKFSWHNSPLWFDGIGGQFSRGVAFVNYTDALGADNPCPSCLYYTEDGQNIYVQYEFGVHPKKYKKAGGSSVLSMQHYSAGDVVNTSDATLFPSGSAFTSLGIKTRISIIPSSDEKDPTAIFEYAETAISVTNVSGTSFTVQDASGLAVGDMIIFEGTATGGYAKLLTTSIDATTNVGNGPVFVITAKSGNILTIADAVGNPQNNLFCRHIHGVSLFSQGLCMYTGEEYPESWFIYMNPDSSKIGNGVNMNGSSWETDTVRLNASENAYQRSLGIYLRNDNKCVYIADSNLPIVSKTSVRGKDIKMGNFGVMVFDLSDIDDNSTALTKIPGVNAGYALYYIGGILFYSDYYGKTYYSEDEGDTWKYICRGVLRKSEMIGFDRFAKRFYFNSAQGRQFIVEVK